MKSIIRVVVLVGFLLAILFVARIKWLEFCSVPAEKRLSDPSYKKTMNYVRGILKRVPFATGHYLLANSYLEEGSAALAVEEYRRALQMNPRFVQAYVALADIYLGRESAKEALELLEKAESLIPNDRDVKALKDEASYVYFLEEGVETFEKGDKVKSRELLNQALRSKPDSAHLHYLLALSYDEKQDFYSAEDHLKKAISLDPKHYWARSVLGDLYFGKGDFEAAIDQYQASLAIGGDNPIVLNNLGLSYMNVERYGSAIPVLEKALALNPSNVETRHSLANLYRDYGMLDKAVKGLLEIIQLKPDDPNIYNDLGDIYKKQGQAEEALKQYRAGIAAGQRILSRGSRNPAILVTLAYAYNGIQEFQMAKKLIDEAILLDPSDPKAYMTLADAYRGFRRFDAALIAMDQAKKLSPKNHSYIDEAIVRDQELLAKQKQ